MGIDLSGYVEVKDRIAQFKKEYPNGRLQAEIVGHFEGYVAVKAYAYRTPDDPLPGTGLAWEPVPGRTPYTKDSELQNCETSAWGRAIVAALIADASSGVASADEVRNRTAGSGVSLSSAPACPSCGGSVYDNRSENYGTNKPLWKCSNKECQGGAPKKNGNGYWPWASWREEEFDTGVVENVPLEPVDVPAYEPPLEYDDDEAPF
jgi:hypothetical protein